MTDNDKQQPEQPAEKQERKDVTVHVDVQRMGTTQFNLNDEKGGEKPTN